MSNTLYDVLHILGKKRSLEFLDLLKKASKWYTQIQKSLEINSKLISSTIKELTTIGAIAKKKDQYELTKIGKKILKKIKPLRKQFDSKKESKKDDTQKDLVTKKTTTPKKTTPAVTLKNISKTTTTPKKTTVKKPATKTAAKPTTKVTTKKAAIQKKKTPSKKSIATKKK